MILTFREDFIFRKLRICEVSQKWNPRENLRIYSSTCILQVIRLEFLKFRILKILNFTHLYDGTPRLDYMFIKNVLILIENNINLFLKVFTAALC